MTQEQIVAARAEIINSTAGSGRRASLEVGIRHHQRLRAGMLERFGMTREEFEEEARQYLHALPANCVPELLGE